MPTSRVLFGNFVLCVGNQTLYWHASSIFPLKYITLLFVRFVFYYLWVINFFLLVLFLSLNHSVFLCFPTCSENFVKKYNIVNLTKITINMKLTTASQELENLFSFKNVRHFSSKDHSKIKCTVVIKFLITFKLSFLFKEIVSERRPFISVYFITDNFLTFFAKFNYTLITFCSYCPVDKSF